MESDELLSELKLLKEKFSDEELLSEFPSLELELELLLLSEELEYSSDDELDSLKPSEELELSEIPTEEDEEELN